MPNSKLYPGCLDFYTEALKQITMARTFLAYTYSLAYQIQNQRQMDLFAVTQSLLEFSIERFDKFMVENTIENLYTKNEGKKDLY